MQVFFFHDNLKKLGYFNTFPKTWSLWHNLVVLHFSEHFLFHLYRSVEKTHKNGHHNTNLAHLTKKIKLIAFLLLRLLMLSWNIITKNWKLNKLEKNFIFRCFFKCQIFGIDLNYAEPSIHGFIIISKLL